MKFPFDLINSCSICRRPQANVTMSAHCFIVGYFRPDRTESSRTRTQTGARWINQIVHFFVRERREEVGGGGDMVDHLL